MKIIQSYWTKPMLQMCNWAIIDYHFITWTLSCLRLKQFYQEVSIYTDDIGKDILIDILKLPYDSVFLELNEIQSVPSQIWTWGKIYTYSLQEVPFLHVDGDVIIGKKLPFDTEPLIAQHVERNFEHNKQFFSLLEREKYSYPDNILLDKENIGEVNAGILGGNNIDFFKDYIFTAKKFMSDNIKNIASSENKNEITAFNTILEQHLFYALAKEHNKEISFLFPEGFVQDDYVRLVNFRKSAAHDYIHPVGYLKNNPYFGEKIAELLLIEAPSTFNIFQTRKQEIYKILGAIPKEKKDNSIVDIHKKKLRECYSDSKIIEDIINIVISCNNENIYNTLFKINPYIKVWKEVDTGQWSMLIPSILSSENELKLVKYSLGVLGQFLFNIIQMYKNRHFKLDDIISQIGELPIEKKVKVIAAIEQLLYMHALVSVKGGN